MRILTETGSTYTINDNLCTKTDKDGERVDQFKVWTMKPVPDHIATWDELHELSEGEPVIGQRLYLGGKDVWWISTRVVEVEW